MRKFRTLRKMSFSQIIALVVITAACAASAAMAGVGGGIISKQITDKYGNVVTVKTNSTEFDLSNLVAEQTTTVRGESDPQSKSSSKPMLGSEKTEFNSSIHAALERMELSPDAIMKWLKEHPKSTLKELEKMSPSMQTKVANIATFIRSVNSRVDKKTAWREASAIVHYCAKYNISTELVVGVAKTESNFQPDLTSKAGARGVMQVMWKYHSGMLQAKNIAASKEQLHDPERGIESGVLLLSRYLETYGTIQKALGRYYGKISESYAKKVDRNVAMLQSHSEKTGF